MWIASTLIPCSRGFILWTESCESLASRRLQILGQKSGLTSFVFLAHCVLRYSETSHFFLKLYSWRHHLKRVPLKTLKYSDQREILVLVLRVCIICRWLRICVEREGRELDWAACSRLHGGMSLPLICHLDALRAVLQPCTAWTCCSPAQGLDLTRRGQESKEKATLYFFFLFWGWLLIFKVE